MFAILLVFAAAVPDLTAFDELASALGSVCAAGASIGFSIWIYRVVKRKANEALDDGEGYDPDSGEYLGEPEDLRYFDEEDSSYAVDEEEEDKGYGVDEDEEDVEVRHDEGDLEQMAEEDYDRFREWCEANDVNPEDSDAFFAYESRRQEG